MYACMYVCIYAYMCRRASASVDTAAGGAKMHVFIYKYVCMYVCMYVYAYAHRDVCMYVCMYVYAYAHRDMYISEYMCINICAGVPAQVSTLPRAVRRSIEDAMLKMLAIHDIDKIQIPDPATVERRALLVNQVCYNTIPGLFQYNTTPL